LSHSASPHPKVFFLLCFSYTYLSSPFMFFFLNFLCFLFSKKKKSLSPTLFFGTGDQT
jgi:hypothetical protein